MRGLSVSLSISCVFLLLALLGLAAQARASGITNAGDDLRTGWYPNEPSITPQLVSGGTFGQLWSAKVEGQVYAQPLLSSGTLLVATEQNKVYGLDPATGTLKWPKPLSLGTPWNPADINCGDLTPSIGVTSTPVIDTTTNIAYMTHKTYASGTSGPARWFMDAVNMASGAEEPGFPVELSGAAQDAPSRVFPATTQLQRPGLLLMGGVVYAAFGSHCDHTPWQGWIFGVSTVGKVTARYVDNTTEEGAGIWQSGSGLTSDGPGTILFSTGNGGAPSKPAAGNTPPANLGESVVRVRVQSDGSLKPVDFFAPFNAPELDGFDADFASGGVTGLPSEYFGTPSVPNLAVADGKQGYVYLLNRDSLGGVSQGPGGSDNVVQRLGPRGGVWSRPGVWPGEGGYVYIPTSSGSSGGGHLDVYKYGLSGTGLPSLSLAASSEDDFGWGSGAPVITSEGTTSGSALVWIIWSTNRTGAGGQLRAYDPVPVGGKPVLRFEAPIGTASNYSTPGVGAGKLFVGTREGKVLAFGSPVSSPLTGPALSFPTTTVGHSSTKTLTLTANESLTVSGLASSSTQFALGTPTPALPAPLSKGQPISIPVTFTPTQTGLVAATVTATSSAGETSFAVSGSGQAEGPLLAFSPPLINFTGTAVGGHSTDAATFRNDGGQSLTINNVELPSPPFSAEGAPKAGDKIAPGGSITVTVAFDPTKAGGFNDRIGLETTGGSGQVGLSGSAGSPGALQISGEVNEYGPVLIGESLTKSFTITNTGGTAVPITKSKPPISGAFVAATSLPEGTTIQAGESVIEQVTYSPTALGPATAEWQINGEDTTGLHKVQFTGTGIELAPSPGGGTLPQQRILAFKTSPPQGRTPDATLAHTLLKETRHGTVSVKVSCPASEDTCSGTVRLQIAVREAARAGRSAAPKTVLLTLASGSFTVPGGQVRSVTLHLSAKARSLLVRHHLLSARAIVAAHDPRGATHTAYAKIEIRSA
jgi:iron transport multicopper oxidase